VVIVVSILLAFGIEAWWQHAQESERTEAALQSLEAGLVLNLSLIDDEIRRLEPFQERLRFFLTAEVAEVNELPSDEVARILAAIERPMVTNLNSSEVLSLLDDDALRSLASPDFRAATAAWRGRWQFILDRHQSIYRVQDHVNRGLARHSSTMSMLLDMATDRQFPDDAVFVARQDEDLVESVAVKASNWRVLRGQYESLSEHADSIRALIHIERNR